MIIRNRHRRSLIAIAVAAAPIGARAAAVDYSTNMPSFACNSSGDVQSISWSQGEFLDGNSAGISVDDKYSPVSFSSVPFSCSSVGASKLAADKAEAIVSGTSFGIDFGQLNSSATGASKFVPAVQSVAYTRTLTGDLSSDKSVTITQSVTDFNLYLNLYDKYDVFQGKDFVGVQVVSAGTANALSPNNSFSFDNNSNLIFDPPIPGGSANIFLLSTPDPQVPEPPSLAMIATGLLGISALMRRRKKYRQL